ncbi:piggyBac transposable element-derived protein 4-like [Triplophysa rosa]|uniref:piggyBac transposable element-derived protein 4-like n=1 Tax=Triplophysa rosa TaxID=992332 RepID=UPI002545C57D|nr:piggyBac transposable element-derived protein 4-like [Triplophysa rosa]
MPSRRCFFHPTYEHPFFGLPKAQELRKKWLHFIFNTVPERYNPTTSLCPKHFTKDSFQNLGAYNAGYSQKLLLKDGAVPTLSGHSDVCEAEPLHTNVQQIPASDDVHFSHDTIQTTKNGVLEATGCRDEDVDCCDQDSVASSVDTTTEEMFIDGLDPILDWPLHEINSPEEDQDSAAHLHRKKRPRLSSTSALPDESNRRNGKGSWSFGDVSERWHSADEADNEPSHPVFTPVQTPGLKFTYNSCSKPQFFFQLFFSETLLEEIVTNTNVYGIKCQTTETQWDQIDLKEFESFIALVIFMGLFKCSSLANYWRDSEYFGLCFPREIMSYQRFLSISNVLYLSDSKQDEKNKKRKGTPEDERLGKIQPLYQVIREACKTYYHPFQNITIDERMMTSQARTGLRKCKKNESNNEHKLFALSDCTNGYTWDFLVNEERSHASHSQGLSSEPLMALVDENSLGTGYKLFVNQFYTSPTLFRDLLQKNIRACGPVKADKKGFPRTTVNSLPRNAARGTMRWIRDKELLFVQWKDVQEIQMCSTFHKAHEGDTVKRKVKRGDRSRTFVDIPIPAAVVDYDRNMEAVDPSNCVTGHFRLIHKPQKWYQSVFYHVLDIAVENAFILQKLTAKAKNRRALTHRTFLEMLILKLIEESPDPSAHSSPTSTARPPAASSAPSSPAPSSDPPSPSASFHKPKHITQYSTTGGRKCKLCQQETTVVCVTCDVMLCFQPQRDCYNDWHEKQRV